MASINRWSPVDDALSLREAVNRLFEESFVRPSETAGGSFNPALDVYETNEGFHVEIALPGIKPDQLDITVQENVLTISGELKQDQREGRNYHRAERRHGSFSRSISFPTQVNLEKINASYEYGILKIDVPKAEEVKPRKVQIQVGSEKTLEAGNKH